MTISRRSFLANVLAAGIAPGFVRRESMGGLWIPKPENMISVAGFDIQYDRRTAFLQAYDAQGKPVGLTFEWVAVAYDYDGSILSPAARCPVPLISSTLNTKGKSWDSN